MDNVGKYIVKSFRVNHVQNNTPTVVTACVNIPLTKTDEMSSVLQSDKTLKPGNWMADAVEADLQVLMRKAIDDGIKDFGVYKYNYLLEMFKLMNVATDMEDKIRDEIVKLNNPANRICENSSCNEIFKTLNGPPGNSVVHTSTFMIQS